VPGFHLAVQQHYFWLSHVSLPFTNILHLIFHHLLLFAFLPPCAHFMYIFSTSLSAYVFFFTSILSHLVSLLLTCSVRCVFTFSRVFIFGTSLFISALGTYLRPDHVRTAARLENWCPRCYNHMLAVFPLLLHRATRG
jgi:hypothetical protein